MPAVGRSEPVAEVSGDGERVTDPGEPLEQPSALGAAVFVRMDGCEAGRVYEIVGASCNLGRATDNEIVMLDTGVSRKHARIVDVGGRHLIEDNGSRNGTYVQGRRVQSAELNAGDLVQFGQVATVSYQKFGARELHLVRQLYESSTRDGLTGLYNRRHFTDRLAAEVAFSRRHKTPLALVTVDVDFFKSINDEHGHPAGDALLSQIGAAMARQIRAEDIIARVGGEEFAVILRGITIDGCARLADRLRLTIAATPFVFEGKTLRVTISLGCASLQGDEVTAAALYAIADDRLYDAKRRGRNCVVAGGGGRFETEHEERTEGAVLEKAPAPAPAPDKSTGSRGRG